MHQGRNKGRTNSENVSQSLPVIKPNVAGMRNRGEDEIRNQLWRFAGHDLTQIDGISPTTASIILTEIGCDLSDFPSEKHFVSWLRLAPRRPISGGKQLKKRPNGTGANRIAGALRMAAVALSRSKTALGAYNRRLARRNDGKTAVFATARKLAQLVFRLLKFGQNYIDIGEQAFEERFRQNRLNGLKRAAEALGFTLTLDAAVNYFRVRFMPR